MNFKTKTKTGGEHKIQNKRDIRYKRYKIQETEIQDTQDTGDTRYKRHKIQETKDTIHTR